MTAQRSSDVLAIQDEDVVAAAQFIREHAEQPLCVADVLRPVNVGRRTLERRYRAAFGWGIAEEIRRTHLERACRLLTTTDLSVQEIAFQAGFSNYRHMAIVFRKQFAITPTAYRREHRHLS